VHPAWHVQSIASNMIAEIRDAMETLHLIPVESFRQDQKFRDQRTLGAGDRVRPGWA
jgi:hypothetical protein